MISSFKSATIVLAVNGIGSALALIYELILAKYLSPTDYGEFRYVYSVVIVFSAFAFFGGAQKNINIFSRSIGASRLAREYFFGLYFLFFFNLVSATLLLILAAHDVLAVDVGLPLICLAGWVFVRTLFLFYKSINVGAGNVFVAQLSDRFVLNGFPIVFLLTYLFFEIDIGFYDVVFFSLISTVIGFLICFGLVFGLPGKFAFIFPTLSDFRNRFSPRMYLASAEAVDTFFRLGLIFVAGYFLEFKEVAVYALVLRLTESMGVVQSAAAAAYSRRIVRESRLGLGCVSSARDYSLFSVGAIGLGFVVAVFFGELVLGFFGEIYSGAYWMLVISAGGYFAKQFFGPSYLILSLLGFERHYFYCSCFFSVILLISTSLALSHQGLFSAVVCGSLLSVLQSIVLSILCYRLTGNYPGLRISNKAA